MPFCCAFVRIKHPKKQKQKQTKKELETRTHRQRSTGEAMLHNPRRKWKEKSRGEWHCNRKVNWNNVGGGEVGRWEKKVENGGYLKRRWWFGYGGYSPQNMNLWVIVFISHSSEWALRVGIPFPFSLFPSFFFSFAPHMCAVCFLSFSAPSSTPPSCSCHLIPCFLLLSFFNILPTLPLGFSFFS